MVADLIEGVRRGDVSALARAISLVESARPGYEDVLSALHSSVGGAHRVGITGPPGAGKSTLIERLVQAYRTRGVTVAVVAVDPTSPYSGGALLGDRIRMERVTLDPGVYIRSMATRGGIGGVATTTREVCDVLDAFGFQQIIIETVGVGQSELAIVGSADTTALVLVPESGDGVQALKAGVMEIADVYVVNKADRPGAARLVQEIEIMLGLRRGHAYRHVGAHHRPGSVPRGDADGASARSDLWEPPVLQTVALRGEGVEALVDRLAAHFDYLQRTGELGRRRRDRLAQHTREVVNRALIQFVWQERDGETALAARLGEVLDGKLSPYGLAQAILATLHKGAAHGGT